MPSSRLTEDGRCIIATPASWCGVGHELRVLGRGGEYGYTFPDWIRRVLSPQPVWTNHQAAPD